MNAHTLRQLIRLLLEKNNLLIEPDATAEGQKAQDEYSGVAAIGGGPALPLGAGPHYPGPDLSTQSQISSQIDVVSRSFGGAKPTRRKKRRRSRRK